MLFRMSTYGGNELFRLLYGSAMALKRTTWKNWNTVDVDHGWFDVRWSRAENKKPGLVRPCIVDIETLLALLILVTLDVRMRNRNASPDRRFQCTSRERRCW
jgi:hypothetical protein